jgi:ubiquinone/menaquinone biosynthesis C-methylase UbiE
MPLSRVLEPEEMAGADEAAEYDSMDFSATDDAFAERAAKLARPGGWIVDIGCGNAKIPLAIAALVPDSLVCAIEMSNEMLAVAARNRARASESGQRVVLVRGDAKRLPFPSRSASLVVSNSLIHHIPDPRSVFHEIARVLETSDGGNARPRILIRDLVRPNSESELASLAQTYSSGWSALQRRLYEDSLHAALSLDEVRAYAAEAGLRGVRIEQVTDRHWSLEPEF